MDTFQLNVGLKKRHICKSRYDRGAEHARDQINAPFKSRTDPVGQNRIVALVLRAYRAGCHTAGI